MSEKAEKILGVLKEVKPVLDKARKPGLLTSEGLAAIATLVVSVIVTFVGVAKDAWWLTLAGQGGAVLVAFVYIAARSGIKKALAQLPSLLSMALEAQEEKKNS